MASAGVEADLRCEALGLPQSADHREVFAALNAYRQANGLSLLIYSKTLEQAAAHQSRGAKQAFRVYYATQTGVHPPRFAIFCNDPDKGHFSVKRYLENSLRERFGFGASPIRLHFRPRRGPAR